jgi:hypothetical protein
VGIVRLDGEHHEGRLAPVGGVEPTPALADMPVDRMARDAESATDFLGAQMLGDEAQAFPFARGKARDSAFQSGVRLVHGEGYGSIIGRASIG